MHGISFRIEKCDSIINHTVLTFSIVSMFLSIKQWYIEICGIENNVLSTIHKIYIVYIDVKTVNFNFTLIQNTRHSNLLLHLCSPNTYIRSCLVNLIFPLLSPGSLDQNPLTHSPCTKEYT